MPRKPLSFTNCHAAGDKSWCTCVASQSSVKRHNSEHSLSRKDCSAGVSFGAGYASNFSHWGLPENSSPSHHTVPASSASCSVCDILGRIFLYTANTGPVIIRRRRPGTPNTAITIIAIKINSSQNMIFSSRSSSPTENPSAIFQAKTGAELTSCQASGKSVSRSPTHQRQHRKSLRYRFDPSRARRETARDRHAAVCFVAPL